ncbi:hypothetical protein LEP1GSC194_3938 [Leptospira alstonii serovar Sichuan str. 79601]|uniref:Uncharacterized protein n=1 Tax=Leptospira alstonii serovar Sichuan str. 79601 TaxID=1218565 RepID=M6D0V4_9LEPT|nr:hypothetical protein LEP1GSC194_3938 [Leptospira alstonii serovar Sichuan str. 79601]
MGCKWGRGHAFLSIDNFGQIKIILRKERNFRFQSHDQRITRQSDRVKKITLDSK